MRTLEVVVGGQYGSEAKGHIVQRLTERAIRQNKATQVIRVAGPNAGHTGYDATGAPWALRQVPVAAVVPGSVLLGIAAGSEIDLPVLLDEIDRLTEAGLMENKILWVHGEATLITQEHKSMENAMQRYPGDREDDLVKRLGSTGKGIGAARSERLMRRASRLMDNEEARQALADRNVAVALGPTVAINAYPGDQHIIVEGTQGYGLGLHMGHYPQCTSSDCRAIDFLAMAGINPWQFDEFTVWVVARIFPIRVAGNSGPLNDETTWEELGLPEERTTVTKKVRRVGLEDWGLVKEAVAANGGAPTVKVALTMFDQKFDFWKDRSLFDPEILLRDDLKVAESMNYVSSVQRVIDASIGIVTTGPNTATFIQEVTE